MKFLALQDRESGKWVLVGPVPSRPYKSGRKVCYKQLETICPKPEELSPFVINHKIITANNEEEAKCLLN